MFEQKFDYESQRMNIKDLSIFITMIVLNFALFVVDCIFYMKGEHTHFTSILVLMLAIIFNGPCFAYFALKVIIMINFKRKFNKFKAYGKKFRAKIIDQNFGEPLIKSDISTIYTYYPKVKFYNYDTRKEEILTSKYAVCASYRKALRSNEVTICVIENDFLIIDFEEANEKEYSLERRGNKSRREADINDRIDRINQIVYAVGAVIIALLMIGLKILRYFLME